MRQPPCDDARCHRLEALTQSLSNSLHDALATPDKTPEDFLDAVEALAIVVAALIVGSQTEASLEHFSRRLLAHIDALTSNVSNGTRVH